MPNQYAMLNYLDNTGNGNHFGADNYFNGTGTGGRYGTYNRFENGSGVNIGFGNEFNSTASSTLNKTGMYNSFTYGNGSGSLYGSFNFIQNTVTAAEIILELLFLIYLPAQAIVMVQHMH
jgi:hypothetical protein